MTRVLEEVGGLGLRLFDTALLEATGSPLVSGPMAEAKFTNGHVAIIAFLLLVTDRVAALLVASRKAKRVLARKVDSSTPLDYQIRSVRWFENCYWVIQAIICLIAFWVIGFLQIVNPTLIEDKLGKIAFASVGFLISIGCSTMNAMIEEIDRRL